MRNVLFMMYDMHCGGVEKALIELLKQLREKTDWQIDLLLLDCRGEFLERIPDGIAVMRCNLPLDIYLETTMTTKDALRMCLKEKKPGTAGLLFWRWLVNRRKDQQLILRGNYARWEKRLKKPDKQYDLAVDFQGMGVFTTFYVAKIVSAEKKATWIHSDISAYPGDMFWQEYLYQSFDKVFCVSGQAKDKVAQRLPFAKDKLDVFYNILPKNEILQKASEEETQLDGTVKILTIGRLSYEKGYDIALRALKTISDSRADFQYYIVGDGEDRQILQELTQALDLQERVHFLGYRQNPYAYLKQCDIYLQPSRFEGFCITLGEAKLFQKPIITTDFVGAREQITDRETGLIIACDQMQMADAIRRLIEDGSLRDQLRDNLAKFENELTTDWRKLMSM